MKKKRDLSTGRKILYSAITCLILFLAIEAVCRLFETPRKYRPSDTMGYEMLPGYKKGQESVNEYGIRGPEIREKRPATFRILAMGGSTTWGHLVADDRTWPAYLERRLHEKGYEHVEVLNGGVSGYGLEQIVRALEHKHLEALKPDLVLVFSGWNYPVMEGNTQMINFQKKAADSEKKDWLHHSALVRLIDNKVQKMKPEMPARGATKASILKKEEKFRTVMAESFPRLYGELVELCRKHGAGLAVIRYPAMVQPEL
ncbi:MAG: SGNH/GDSL hydrolase family protein, partial [Planctomycetes bacterium]|nr:SGNH/GDSL hydrolase family protein [Planctomycetota bacterium]